MSRTLAVLKMVFYVNIVFLLLLSLPYLYMDPGPQTRVVTLLALVPIGIMLVASAVLTYIQSSVFDF